MDPSSLDDAAGKNRLYYGSPAAGRDDYWRKMAAPRARVARIRDAVGGIAASSLVDLGCGNGVLLEELAAVLPSARLAGIDFSAEQIASNASRLSEIEWHVSNLDHKDALPEAIHGAFDCVVASEVIEHVQSPEQFLRNARALASGRGRLILSTQSGVIRETERRVGHVRHFTAEQMRELLRNEGWAPLRVWNEGFPFHDLSKWWANRNPDASMGRFGENAYGWRENLVCLLLRAAFRLNSSRRGAQLFAIAAAT